MPNKKEVKYYIDDIYHARWEEGQIRRCPHPYLIEKYGHAGKCIVTLHTCRKCKFRLEYPMHGGLGCSYGKEDKPDGNK